MCTFLDCDDIAILDCISENITNFFSGTLKKPARDVFRSWCNIYYCWGFSPRDLEATNLKEGHLDSLLQGLTSLFLQSSFFIEAGTKSLKYAASRVHTELTHNQ